MRALRATWRRIRIVDGSSGDLETRMVRVGGREIYHQTFPIYPRLAVNVSVRAFNTTFRDRVVGIVVALVQP